MSPDVMEGSDAMQVAPETRSVELLKITDPGPLPLHQFNRCGAGSSDRCVLGWLVFSVSHKSSLG